MKRQFPRSTGVLLLVAFLLVFAFSISRLGAEFASVASGLKKGPKSKGLAKSPKKCEPKAPSVKGEPDKAELERIGKKYLGTEVERGSTEGRRVVLTFDAATASGTGIETRILDTLKKKRVKAAFFLTGQWVKDNPALTKRIADDGHELGNHLYSHENPTGMGDEAILQELNETEALIRKATGKSVKPYFRAPSGDRDQRVIADVAREGYFHVYWSIDTIDWQPGTTENEVEGRVFSSLSPGAIILCHLNYEAEARALPVIIDELRHRGYSIVGLSEILKDK